MGSGGGMRSDTDLIWIDQLAARMKYGKARGMAVARKPRGGVPYRWAGSRLQPGAEAASLPFDGYVVHVPSARRLGRFVGRLLGGTPLQWVFVLLLLGLLTLAAIPLRSSGGGEARSSEARAALGAMKDRARVVYQRTGKAPATLKELGLTDVELRGSYFDASHYRITNASPERWTAQCSGVYSGSSRDLILTANLANGSASFNR
jgi:type II secretory pathway pseudopilin PulG